MDENAALELAGLEELGQEIADRYVDAAHGDGVQAGPGSLATNIDRFVAGLSPQLADRLTPDGFGAGLISFGLADEGASLTALDLDALIGRALVVDAGAARDLSEEVLESLSIPPEARRILFHTSNSDIWTRGDKEFTEDYVGVTESGARWLIERGVKLVGIDYLSVAAYKDTLEVHHLLLGKGVVLLETLNLEEVEAGNYELICIPLKLEGADGAPTRAVLVKES